MRSNIKVLPCSINSAHVTVFFTIHLITACSIKNVIMSYAHVINNYATAIEFFLLLDSKKVLKKFVTDICVCKLSLPIRRHSYRPKEVPPKLKEVGTVC
jgi:hypothetical protein